MRRSSGTALTVVLGALAGYLLYRGVTGRRRRGNGETGSAVGDTVSACSQVTVQRPIGEVYGFWRDLGNLPKFSRFVRHVEAVGEGAWRLTAHTPWGASLDWEVRQTVDQENGRLAWCAVEGADLPSAVEVRMLDGGHGTEVFVDAWLVPPAPGILSPILRTAESSRPLRRAGLTPSQLLQQDLRRFRQLVETGETATVKGQTSGRAA